ncbi:MAG: T9SS type A sorting domain-containing protein [Candidatus Cloacimonetes bacterium]|nr:T9SS type A sorting domain-containing protein [Candidatus Cloacimonadota bacterium]MCF7868661.1 T9SS type A sorting domain-containing protein [Candidatus Cloacimonadota bacterium]
MKKINIILVCLFLAGMLSSNTAEFDAETKDELLDILGSEAAIEQFIADMQDWEKNRTTRKEHHPKDSRTTYNTQMVIITNSTLESIFEQFAKIKNQEGIKTEVLTTSTTGSSASSIRAYLASLKTSNSDLTYVLLGGDASIIPTKSFYWTKNGATKTSSTDFYYSNVLSTWPGSDDVDDIVLTVDLYVGRVPVRTTAEALYYVNKYKDYRTEETDYTDEMAFIATNIQKIADPAADDLTIDYVVDDVGANITTDILYTDDLVNVNGCAYPIINKLQTRDFSFLYGIWHANYNTFAFFDSDYDQFDGEWYERQFDDHDQKLTLIEYSTDYGVCWYETYRDSAKYYYSGPADNFYYLQDEIPNTFGSSYFVWLGSCSTTDMISQSYYTPVQFENSVVVQNYNINGYNTSYSNPYNVNPVPTNVSVSTDCIAVEYFNEIGGPVALYASSVDDCPYFTFHLVEEYMDLQFEDDYHKLGYITRESWDRFSNYLNNTKVREMYIGYTLFGDPSMDVWSAETEQLTTILKHGGIQLGYTFTTINSSGNEVDAEIVVTSSSGTILGKGDSPYTYTGTISTTDIITSNTANYIQAISTWSEIENYAGLPYSMSFENGIDYNWEMHSNNSYGRIQVTDQNTPHSGNQHLTMDSNSVNSYATNEAWLHLDLEGENRVKLDFWWKEFSDETHTADGVYFSDDDGSTFTKVYSLSGGTTTWQEITLDLDALCATYNLDYSNNFIIKFQQYDDNSIASDGFAFDDINVYAEYSEIPYNTGFESGMDEYWTSKSNNLCGRIQVTSSNSPYSGSYHLTMDSNTGAQYVTNEACLYIDFTDITQADLSFYWKEFADENNTEDGIYFSDDGGSNFTKVYSLNGQSYRDRTWEDFSLDVDVLASNNDLELTNRFVIKFQQRDNNPISGYFDNDGFAFDNISITSSGGGSDTYYSDDLLPTESRVSIYPNPFNPQTSIALNLTETDKQNPVSVGIYNVKGQLVRTLVDNEVITNASIIWDGTDNTGRHTSSGMYFAKVNTQSNTITKKMVLLK